MKSHGLNTHTYIYIYYVCDYTLGLSCMIAEVWQFAGFLEMQSFGINYFLYVRCSSSCVSKVIVAASRHTSFHSDVLS